MKAKKLIEVAMPIKEISAESERDKHIRVGHISTLHYWPARRPIPTCRAIIFASLIPDPLDEKCPQAFRSAVKNLLGKPKDGIDMYCPYQDIPYTAALDMMEDNLRNRLMMFIGKFSDKCQNDLKAGKNTSPKDQLSDGSLVKWENKNNPQTLRIARELIWVAYNSDRTPSASYEQLHDAFNSAFDAIIEAEQKLYSIRDRHIVAPNVQKAERNLKEAIEHFQDNMPSVFDPFAGGGAIPLEAARLGCRSYGNDINPVAHLIERSSAEYPQRYGKTCEISKAQFEQIYGDDSALIKNGQNLGVEFYGDSYLIRNKLAFDVSFYANKLIKETEKKVEHVYPKHHNRIPSVYYWTKTCTCDNCKKQVPLISQIYLSKPRSNNKNERIKHFEYSYTPNGELEVSIENGRTDIKPTINKGNVTCPYCGSITDKNSLKDQFSKKKIKEIVTAAIYDNRGKKEFESVSRKDGFETEVDAIIIDENKRPQDKLYPNSAGGDILIWGYSNWGEVFNNRQLFVLSTFCDTLNEMFDDCEGEYPKVIKTYLAMLINRIALRMNAFCKWHNLQDTVEHPYANNSPFRMHYDYPELNPFSTASNAIYGQLTAIINYIEEEGGRNGLFPATFNNISSGEELSVPLKGTTATITDPPYYDAIAYADMSDFFYLWMKRTLGEQYPYAFATPQTPKTEECTALKHHHNNSLEEANNHFETKLTKIFDSIEKQTTDIVNIMFAHKSTQAWTTLCNSVLNARMNITGSWSMDTEMIGALKAEKSFLESSVTVACRPSERKGFGEFREVKRDIERKVKEEVESLYALGFRGADLLTACFGQAVSEFGRYKTVEKADGSTVTVAELLDLAKQTAFNALLQGIDADDETRFYIGWLQMNGMGETDFDDATKFTRVGMNIEIGDIFRQGLLVRDGNKQHLATAAEHLEAHSKSKGTSKSDLLIEQVHRAMLFYKGSGGDRRELLRLIRDVAPDANDSFWRVLASLKELLPAGDDLQQVQGLLQNGENLRRECKDVDNQTFTQGTITFGE